MKIYQNQPSNLVRLEKKTESSFCTPCGLYLLKPHPYLGATADNILSCECCTNKYCVEYKCPYSIRERNIFDSWSETGFLEKNGDQISLKKNHKYYFQVQGQMAITEIPETYFVVWTKVGEPLIEKIELDVSFWAKVFVNLVVFFKSFVQPILLGLKTIYTCPVGVLPCLDENEFDTADENSIECGKCLMWFHWGCCNIDKEDDDFFVLTLTYSIILGYFTLNFAKMAKNF